MEKRSSFMTPLSLSLFLLLIIIAALQLEASVPMKTFHFVNEGKNWSDARQYCKDKFTDLASGPGEDLLNAVAHHGGRSVWIGLYRDPGDPFVWRWTGERRRDASSDTNWATGEPEMKNCTSVVGRMWHNLKCSETYHSDCSDGERIEHVYSGLSWHDALKSCEKMSMVLATVTPSNKNHFTHGWIGLHMPPPNAPGASINTWQWIGDDSDFRHWAPGQPDFHDCGFLSFVTNKWHGSRCSDERPFMCVVDNGILVKENKTWEEALEHCRAIGSVDSSRHNHYRDHRYDLVSLQSEDDHRYARDKIQEEATTNEVWTALRFLAGQWLWVDGEPQQYQNLPLCPAWGRHCGTLPKDHSTQWQVRDCRERRNFLCIKSTAG